MRVRGRDVYPCVWADVQREDTLLAECIRQPLNLVSYRAEGDAGLNCLRNVGKMAA